MYQYAPILKSKKLLGLACACALAAVLALAGCAAGDGADAGASGAAGGASNAATQGEASVTVSVTMPEGADAESQSAEVSIPADGTVYDALVATGWAVEAADSDYGKYVTAINGVANGSQGDMSGWVFTVNGEEVMEGCSTCTLAAGDTVEWTFFV